MRWQIHCVFVCACYWRVVCQIACSNDPRPLLLAKYRSVGNIVVKFEARRISHYHYFNLSISSVWSKGHQIIIHLWIFAIDVHSELDWVSEVRIDTYLDSNCTVLDRFTFFTSLYGIFRSCFLMYWLGLGLAHTSVLLFPTRVLPFLILLTLLLSLKWHHYLLFTTRGVPLPWTLAGMLNILTILYCSLVLMLMDY